MSAERRVRVPDWAHAELASLRDELVAGGLDVLPPRLRAVALQSGGPITIGQVASLAALALRASLRPSRKR